MEPPFTWYSRDVGVSQYQQTSKGKGSIGIDAVWGRCEVSAVKFVLIHHPGMREAAVSYWFISHHLILHLDEKVILWTNIKIEP